MNFVKAEIRNVFSVNLEAELDVHVVCYNNHIYYITKSKVQNLQNFTKSKFQFWVIKNIVCPVKRKINFSS